MGSQETQLWSYREIAAHIGVKPATVKSYRRQGILPPPDLVDGLGRPCWRPATIHAWVKRRPHNRG